MLVERHRQVGFQFLFPARTWKIKIANRITMCQWRRRYYSNCRHRHAIPPPEPCQVAWTKINNPSLGLQNDYRYLRPRGTYWQWPKERLDSRYCDDCNYLKAQEAAEDQISTGSALHQDVAGPGRPTAVLALIPVIDLTKDGDEVIGMQSVVPQRPVRGITQPTLRRATTSQIPLPYAGLRRLPRPEPRDLSIHEGEQQTDYMLRLTNRYCLSSAEAHTEYVKRLSKRYTCGSNRDQ